MTIESRWTHFFVLLFSLLIMGSAVAASKADIDRGVADALTEFRDLHPDNAALVAEAEGVLVFPSMTRAGFGVGGEYGEGALQIDGVTQGYYSLASASVGFRFGVARYRQMVLFMTESSLNDFRRSDGWAIGGGAGVTVVDEGMSASYDVLSANQAILVFAFSGRGLLGDLSIAGSKVSPIER